MTKIKFNKKAHTYTLGKEKLDGVTSYISQFFDKFDINKIAKIKAFLSKKAGEPQKGVRYWKTLWKKNATDGTEIHKLIDMWVKKTLPEDMNGFALPENIKKFQSGIDELLAIYNTFDKDTEILTEEIVVDEQLKLAGTVDCIIKHKKGITIIDWKTNEKIAREGYKGKMATEPISEYADCAYNKYMLQLSMYAYMLERKGYKIYDLYLVNIREGETERIMVPYKRELIERILKYGKKI